MERKVPQEYAFLNSVIPAIALVLLVGVNVAVNMALRDFAASLIIQASLAGLLAFRK